VNPPTIRYAYRDRNVIERAFNTVNHGRGLTTRYDKHALIYRGALVPRRC
jgi:transposase